MISPWPTAMPTSSTIGAGDDPDQADDGPEPVRAAAVERGRAQGGDRLGAATARNAGTKAEITVTIDADQEHLEHAGGAQPEARRRPSR